MRLHRLQIQAFGPFADRQSIDFDALDAAGLYLIHGATGAGKTSILDAVCYAVYGAIPGSRSGHRETIRSDHADPSVQAYVQIEFTAAGERIRIRRSPEWNAPKKRSAGTTRRPATVSLEVLRAGEWIVQSTRMDEAAEIVTDHLGMGLEQFAQVVLLPQGEFATFLRAKPEERAALLSRLFDIERFSHAQAWLAERKRNLSARVRDADAAVNYQSDRLTDLLTELDLPRDAESAGTGPTTSEPGTDAADVESVTSQTVGCLDPIDLLRTIESCRGLAADNATRALVVADRAQRDRDLARDAVIEGDRTLQLQAQARQARSACVTYEARTVERDAEVEDLAAAHRAAVVAPVAAAHTVAGRDLASADLRVQQSAAEIRALVGAPRRGEPHLSRTALAAAVRAGGSALAGLPDIDLQHAAAERAIDQVTADLQSCIRRRSQVDERITQLDLRMEDISRDLDSDADGPDAVGVAEHRLAAALAAVRTAERLIAAEVATTAAETAASKARSAFAAAEGVALDLRRRRLAGIVGELAADLREGCACPVCGSSDHPDVADAGTDPVSADDVEVAESSAAVARSAHTQSDGALQAARSRWEERRAAHRISLQQLDAHLTESDKAAASDSHCAEPRAAELRTIAAAAREVCATAEARRAQRSLLRTRAQQTVALIATAQQDHLAVELEVGAATVELHGAEQRLREAATAAGERRDRHIAVCWCNPAERAEPVAGHSRLELALEALQRADSALETATAVLDRSTADVAEMLAAQGFTDLEQSELAAVDPARIIDLQSAISTERAFHDRALGVLEQPQVIESESVQAPDLVTLHDVVRAAEHRRVSTAQAVSAADRGVRELLGIQVAVGEAVTSSAADRNELAVLGPLADVAAGSGDNVRRMRLTSYILAARLEMVTDLANERLLSMSDGRFTLEHTDELVRGGARSGLGLRVLDGWTGRARDTGSLSGGEAFIASLALALGLGDAVLNDSGGRPLQSLFVDEGFGSLDEQTLDQVMSMLDGLRAGGRSVGIVSHVGELRDRILHRVEVSKSETGSHLVVHPGPDAVGA